VDSRLSKLIQDYLKAVEEAVRLFEQMGVERPADNTAWACNEIPQKGLLPGGIEYFKHGYGCAVNLPSGPVDFDFGEEGQINGFDLWRLTRYADERLDEYGFESEKEIEGVFNQSINASEFRYSGYILYYLRAR
jgi:hypothetical protein